MARERLAVRSSTVTHGIETKRDPVFSFISDYFVMPPSNSWGILPPYKRAALPPLSNLLAALGPGVIFMALAHITFDWTIRAEKPLLRYLSLILKPLFAANHRWAMSQGEKSLHAELARRRSASPSRFG